MLFSISSSGERDPAGSVRRKSSRKSRLLNDGPATTEKLRSTGCSPIVYATPPISGRTRNRANGPLAPDGLLTSARNQLSPPATPHALRGLSRTSGPNPTSESTSPSVGWTHDTVPPTLTRPFVCASTGSGITSMANVAAASSPFASREAVTWVSHGSRHRHSRLPASRESHRELLPHHGYVSRRSNARRFWRRPFHR